MMKTLRHVMASAALVSTLFVAPLAVAQTAAPAAIPQAEGQGPAMWVIRDADSTLYLFGSFHFLRSDTKWGQAHVDAAFASADEIWFEATDVDDAAQAMQLMQTYGLSPDRPLSSVLKPEDIAALNAALAPMGATAAAFDPMRPWLVSLQLAVVQLTAAGFDPNSGVDKVMLARAASLGKPAKGLESMAEQIRIFSGISEQGQVEMLRGTLKDLDKGPAEVEALLAAWATGNTEVMGREMIDKMKAEQPEAYEALFTRRNANWTRQIKTILDGSGTAFVVVGAGHLVGQDSVQSMLAAEGITAERVTH
ncbi:TraB/GumN family protein [Brevundimonas sp. BH3]|uniref:TraB/GumN family protein n=1 Tax=Brevundimonas sp. BH3 TaxID=3133089 RepID=UPI0032513938